MANRRKQYTDYVKEVTKQITLTVSISQYQLLEQFTEGTNRPMADVISEVFSDTAVVSIRRMLAANAKPSTEEPAASRLPDLAAAKPTLPPTLPSGPQPPKAVPVEPSVHRPVENPAVNDPTRTETLRSQQPTNPGVANPSRPPQLPTSPSIAASATQQTVPPRTPVQPLPPTPPRPAPLPSAKPPAGDAELSPRPETRHE